MILYASITGNTQQIALMLAKFLDSYGVKTELVTPEIFTFGDLQPYQGLLIGTYTYGNDANIPDEMLDVYEWLQDQNLKGLPFGVFGSGDLYYGSNKFCKASLSFQNLLIKCGGESVYHPVKVDKYPDFDDDIQEIQKLACHLATEMKEWRHGVCRINKSFL
ncbi:flavodoxin domain-containing protein [Suicoccus acidiformans]|uniref:flavodoxin domain-containing protein n=1 Tax=Suicoccus acidiformans TaxID=2036206 RepID=UPI0013C2D972|nr:flavodoxin domain-containing protein [Suicoccus acidiformans]